MTSSEKISKGMTLLAEGFAESIQKMAEAVVEAFKNVSLTIKPLLDKKYTKKKFMKMLQSYEIQRNEINRIIANNKEPYTMSLLYKYIKKGGVNK